MSYHVWKVAGDDDFRLVYVRLFARDHHTDVSVELRFFDHWEITDFHYNRSRSLVKDRRKYRLATPPN
jgi:hypothetical protein